MRLIQGLNASKKTLFEYADLMNHSDCLFYLLDENEIIYPEDEIKNILDIYPVFQDLKHCMKKIYKTNFNEMASHRFQNVILWKLTHNAKQLILRPSAEQEEKARALFMLIQDRLKLNLIDLLPKEPLFIQESRGQVKENLKFENYSDIRNWTSTK